MNYKPCQLYYCSTQLWLMHLLFVCMNMCACG